MPLYRQQQADRVWRLLPVDPLATKTVLIVGMGRIGRAVGDRLRAFGPRIVGVTRTGAPLPEAERVLPEARLDEVLPEADVIVLLTPLTPATRGLFGRERLLRCKPGAHIINVARGPVLDAVAARELVLSGHLSAATLDVFDTEPLPPEDPIWNTPGIAVTPHVSGELADWQTHAAMLFSDNLAAWTAGRPLQNLCEPTRGY